MAGEHLLYEALATPLGVEVEVPTPADVERLRQQLYRAKQSDPTLKVLSLLPSPHSSTHLWIVKREEPDDGRKDAEGDT